MSQLLSRNFVNASVATEGFAGDVYYGVDYRKVANASIKTVFLLPGRRTREQTMELQS